MLETTNPAAQEAARQMEDAKKAEALTERLTSKELAEEIRQAREIGLMLRRFIGDMPNRAARLHSFQALLEKAVIDGSVTDPDFDRPSAETPTHQISPQEVLKRMQARQKEDARIHSGEEVQLTGWLQHLNQLARTYNLNFYIDRNILLDRMRARALDRRDKLSGQSDSQSGYGDSFVVSAFEDAVRARLWELTTPEGTQRR